MHDTTILDVLIWTSKGNTCTTWEPIGIIHFVFVRSLTIKVHEETYVYFVCACVYIINVSAQNVSCHTFHWTRGLSSQKIFWVTALKHACFLRVRNRNKKKQWSSQQITTSVFRITFHANINNLQWYVCIIDI